MSFSTTIFREYDVRGVFEKDYDVPFAGLLAKAYATLLQEKLSVPQKGRVKFRVAVGQDVRPSGELLAPEFKRALESLGVDVLDLGVCPTPLTYFSLFQYDVDGAVSITGSHNPSEYNGFKMCVGKDSLHGDSIQKLRKIIESGSFKTLSKDKGTTDSVKVIEDYQNQIKKDFRIKNPIRVVLDSGNATGGLVAPKLFKDLGCDVIELYCDVDGTFPNHHPDPTVEENLLDLKAAVKKHGADLGIAYDGDADRIGAVDENGRTLYGDELMVLFSREILSRKPGAKIIGEVKCSTRMYEDIKKHGGTPIMWKTGHSLIKTKLKAENAELAGEMSGHIFFKDRYYGYDDAIYASLRLVEIFDKNLPKTFSSLLKDLPTSVCTPEIRVDCPDETKFQIVERVKEKLKSRFTVIDIDGVRIETPKGWGLIRASNTQPVVVMRFEALNDQALKEIQAIIEKAFEEEKASFLG